MRAYNDYLRNVINRTYNVDEKKELIEDIYGKHIKMTIMYSHSWKKGRDFLATYIVENALSDLPLVFVYEGNIDEDLKTIQAKVVEEVSEDGRFGFRNLQLLGYAYEKYVLEEKDEVIDEMTVEELIDAAINSGMQALFERKYLNEFFEIAKKIVKGKNYAFASYKNYRRTYGVIMRVILNYQNGKYDKEHPQSYYIKKKLNLTRLKFYYGPNYTEHVINILYDQPHFEEFFDKVNIKIMNYYDAEF